MRTFCLVMVLFLVFTGCNRQQVKPRDAAKHTSPMVIDYPAGVMIAPKNPASSPVDRKFTFAEGILLPHRIPVLDTNASEMVFVKLNGDRITIDMNELAGNYDIILFNAISNPVPLRINDLQGAFNQIFNLESKAEIPAKGMNYAVKTSRTAADTIKREAGTNWLQQLKARDKKIVVMAPDTSTRKFAAPVIRGVQWVEQRVDTRTLLKINFENDLITYANTDRYFTNGVTIELQAAWLGRMQVQKLMVPYNHKANLSYSVQLVQDMYTPTDTRMAPTLENDRPYASYLYVGFSKTAADPLREIKLTSGLDIGYLGPYSPGSYLQTLVHNTFPTNDVPLGWETQIGTDIILDYNVQFEKALVNNKNLTLLAGLDVKAGTMHSNAGAGLRLQAGKAEPVFGLGENEQWPNTECYFFAESHISYVAYNALLQGGIVNHNNTFTLQSGEIQRVVGSGETGFHIQYKGIGIEVAQHYLSPEFKGGLWHKWGRMSLLFRL